MKRIYILILLTMVSILYTNIAYATSTLSNTSAYTSRSNDVREAYLKFYRGKIAKDSTALMEVLDETFVLVHMTGTRQTRKEFIDAVLDGTLNYYTAEHGDISVQLVNDNEATLIGQTKVLAAVYGGGRHTWPLQLKMKLIYKNNKWLITEAVASTY